MVFRFFVRSGCRFSGWFYLSVCFFDGDRNRRFLFFVLSRCRFSRNVVRFSGFTWNDGGVGLVFRVGEGGCGEWRGGEVVFRRAGGDWRGGVVLPYRVEVRRAW